MDNVTSIFPANDFKQVCGNASQTLQTGLIIGYTPEGLLEVYGGGMIDGKQPVTKDWLWLVETFKQNLISGHYSGD